MAPRTIPQGSSVQVSMELSASGWAHAPDRARRGACVRDDRGRRPTPAHRVRHRARVRADQPSRANERLVAGALCAAGLRGARIVTKGGMTRPGRAWVPDGRAKAILADCHASIEALDGLPIDLYLIHAPDPRTPWRTSVRALARLVDDGLVRRVGSRTSPATSSTRRSSWRRSPPCRSRSARSTTSAARRCCRALRRARAAGDRPLAARRSAPRGALARRERLLRSPLATTPPPPRWRSAGCSTCLPRRRDPGARRPRDRAVGRAGGRARLGADDQASLTLAFGGGAAPATAPARGEVVIVMGIPGGQEPPGSGLRRRGYARLNRDERGGSLRALADELDAQLAAGARGSCSTTRI